jgi:hydrogenase nickel incorporation protein HypA/HybF
MHELYIAECILQSARRALPPGADPDTVERLRVRVGKLDAVVPESLLFLFDAIKASHHMPHAQMEIVEQDVRCSCRRCSNEFALSEPVFICPQCGSGDVSVLAGRGIFLENMIIHDEVSCGNTCCP